MTQAEREAEYDRRVAAQTAALRALGFGPAVGVGGGLFGREAASCLTCGALALLDPQDGDDNPVRVHHAWHEPDPTLAVPARVEPSEEVA